MEDNKFNIFWTVWVLICAATTLTVLGVGIMPSIDMFGGMIIVEVGADA